MNRISPKNATLLFLSVFLMTSCGLADVFLEPYHPVSTSKAPFPMDQAARHDYTHVMAQDCLAGKAVGRHVMNPFETQIATPPRWIRHSGPASDGKGKMYKMYLVRGTIPPPPYNEPRVYDHYGYSFTFLTTEEDIILECRVTQQFLYRW